jgi:hypothetical protein
MNVRMFFEIGLLGKSLVTTMKFTLIRFFICVDPKMVEKIVPFPENFVATRMSAVQ